MIIFIFSSITALIIFIFGIRYFLKRRTKTITEIPENVLEEFQEAERRYDEIVKDGKEISRQQILWDIANDRFKKNTKGNDRETEGNIISTGTESVVKLSGEDEVRRDVQDNVNRVPKPTTTDTNGYDKHSERIERHNESGNTISRFFRKFRKGKRQLK